MRIKRHDKCDDKPGAVFTRGRMHPPYGEYSAGPVLVSAFSAGEKVSGDSSAVRKRKIMTRYVQPPKAGWKMTKFTGVNHLAFATHDMAKTIRFWRDLLGMRLVAGIGKTGYRHYFFELSATDMVAFFEWPAVEDVPVKDHGVPVKGPFAFDHVSFGVESDADLWSLKDKLEAAGFWVSEVIDHGFIHSVYAFDPNHIPIEFSAPVSGIDLRRRPKMVDRSPSKPALEGPEPQSGHWPAVTEPTPADAQWIFPGEGMALLDLDDDPTD